ncbi:MAG TPA: metallopeptidase, partial [Alphaproteobacteria bacterium]|nr:metallopeptidase [Alphaproteobacteria bacterium]
MRAACILAAATLPMGGGASAQDGAPTEDLRRIEGEMEAAQERRAALDARAAEIEAELARLRQQSIEAATDILVQQSVLQNLEEELSALEAEATERERRLDDGRAQLAELLGGLTRLARLPPEALIAQPEAPVDALRSSLLLQAAIPAVDAKAA